MKKAITVLGYILFVLVIMLPLGTILCTGFGYTFTLASPIATVIVTTLISVSLVILCVINKEPCTSRILGVLFALSLPISLVSAAIYMLDGCKIWILYVLVHSVCCAYLAVKHGKPLALKIISVVLSALMILPLVFLGFLSFIFGDFGLVTVVRSVDSPNGKYRAEMIDYDQGALGGSTFVDVHKTKSFNAGIFKIERKPQRVFSGDWGEFSGRDIYWKDENTLVINDVEYEIE